MILAAIEPELGEKPSSLDPEANWGTLILDATCAPDDIPYPVDLRLLNVDEVFSAGVARETTEAVINELFKQDLNWHGRKPRCNQDKVRKSFSGNH